MLDRHLPVIRWRTGVGSKSRIFTFERRLVGQWCEMCGCEDSALSRRLIGQWCATCGCEAVCGLLLLVVPRKYHNTAMLRDLLDLPLVPLACSCVALELRLVLELCSVTSSIFPLYHLPARG